MKVSRLAGQNERFTEEEKHYLRFLLKIPNAFTAVLNGERPELPKNLLKAYDRFEEKTDTGKLH